MCDATKLNYRKSRLKNIFMITIPLQFWAIVYYADNAFYQNGQSVPIYCKHQVIGDFGMSTVGEITPLPGATVPNTDVALTLAPTAYPNPPKFADAGFKAVKQVKDLVTLTTFYVDSASYNANVIQCFPSNEN